MNPPILETIDLRMVYHVGHVEVQALRGVDIQVQKGEFVAIIGPSGCGKSTLLHLLGGLARPTSGRIMVGGVEVSAAGDFERTAVRRQKIGFVFQRFNLFPTLTVRGNLEIARQIQGNGVPPKDELVRLLEMVGLPHKMDMKPLDLSAGEQQRIAIQRALVNHPAIVLADEPTGNLDSKNGMIVMEVFEKLAREQGLTVVMVTHERTFAAMASRQIALRDGQVVSDVDQRDGLSVESS